MITLDDYWMGRDALHPLDMSPTIAKNAKLTISLVNTLLETAIADGGYVAVAKPSTMSLLSSGWRPPSVNAATPGASPNSLHMTGQAADVYDPGNRLDSWLLLPQGQAALERIGLWLEWPGATESWTHLQTIPPRSGRRVFRP